jgi:hypothetical protein
MCEGVPSENYASQLHTSGEIPRFCLYYQRVFLTRKKMDEKDKLSSIASFTP